MYIYIYMYVCIYNIIIVYDVYICPIENAICAQLPYELLYNQGHFSKGNTLLN